MKEFKLVLGFVSFILFLFTVEPYIYKQRRNAITDVSELKIFSEDTIEACIIGSSRSARGVSAELLTSKTSEVVINLSFPGTSFDFHFWLLQKLVDENRVYKVYFNLDPMRDTNVQGKVKFPSDIIERNWRELSALDLSRYEALGYTISKLPPLNLNMRSFDWRGNVDKFSFRNHYGDMLILGETLDQCQSPIMFHFNQEHIRKIIEYSEQHEIDLVLTFVPDFCQTGSNFNYAKYYYDSQHLNKTGAMEFTQTLIN